MMQVQEDDFMIHSFRDRWLRDFYLDNHDYR